MRPLNKSEIELDMGVCVEFLDEQNIRIKTGDSSGS